MPDSLPGTQNQRRRFVRLYSRNGQASRCDGIQPSSKKPTLQRNRWYQTLVPGRTVCVCIPVTQHLPCIAGGQAFAYMGAHSEVAESLYVAAHPLLRHRQMPALKSFVFQTGTKSDQPGTWRARCFTSGFRRRFRPCRPRPNAVAAYGPRSCRVAVARWRGWPCRHRWLWPTSRRSSSSS